MLKIKKNITPKIFCLCVFILVSMLVFGFFIYSNIKIVSAESGNEGPSFAGTIVNDNGIGTQSWSNTSNAEGDNNNEATVAPSSPAVSNYLKATNFGFDIPSNATIQGIKVEWEKEGNLSNFVDEAVRIVKNGNIGTTDKSAVDSWGSFEYVEYGGENDLWGESWTVNDINSSDFGTALSVECTDCSFDFPPPPFAAIRRVRITVYYFTTSEDITVTASIAEYFKLEVSTTTLALGELISSAGVGSVGEASLTATTSSNRINGYTLAIKSANGSLDHTTGAATGTIASSSGLAEAGTDRYGAQCSSSDLTCQVPFTSGGDTVGQISTSDTALASIGSASADDVTTVTVKASASLDKAPGNYTDTVTLTALSNL